MEKKEIKVVIVEDDPTLGKALSEAVKSAGFQPLLFTRPDDVIGAVKYNPPHAYVIDCMLPKTNGVNLALTLREMGAIDTPMLFMSGIFRDKHFIRDTLQKTKGVGFLTKPFNIEELSVELERLLSPLVDTDSAREALLDILTDASIKPDKVLEILRTTSSLHAYEVPRLMSMLIESGLLGILTLKSPESDPIKVHFTTGGISKVEMKVTKSYFGALLLERNLVEPDELTRVLNMKSEKPIGERLVDENLLSPHMIGLVGIAQTCLRLSSIVTDKTFEIAFETTPAVGESILDNMAMVPLYSEWVRTKLPLAWIKTFYLPWMDNFIFKTQEFTPHHPALKSEPFTRFPTLIQALVSDITITKLLQKTNISEDDFYNCIHILVLNRLIVFDRTQKVQDVTDLVTRLRSIHEDMQGRTHFEILGVSKSSKTSDIKRAYHELAKTFHPDKVKPGMPEEIKNLTNAIFNRMNVAYDVLREDLTRATYIKELERGQATQILQSEALIEEGKGFLRTGQIQKAFDCFKKAESLRPPTTELVLHLMWATILLLGNSSSAVADSNDINKRLNKIPPEDRHSAIYYFVKGIYLRYLGDFELAKSNFKQSLFLEPNFKEAQRELKFAELAQSSRPVDLLSGDLTTVIGSLFKRKK